MHGAVKTERRFPGKETRAAAGRHGSHGCELRGERKTGRRKKGQEGGKGKKKAERTARDRERERERERTSERERGRFVISII